GFGDRCSDQAELRPFGQRQSLPPRSRPGPRRCFPNIGLVAAFLLKVGVNAAHRVRSPLFGDGAFQLHPIPEAPAWTPPMVRRPEVWGDRAVHLDPDLVAETPTYGDNCRRAARAFALRRARIGDL